MTNTSPTPDPTAPAEEQPAPPSHAVAGYLLNRLANPMSVDQEVLLTLLFYLEKSQGLPAIGADDALLAQLERETFADTVTQQLRAGLLRLMVNPPTPQFFHQALGVLLRFNDAQLQPFLVTWLDAQLRQLLQANQAINQLLLSVKPVKGVPRRSGGSVPDIEGNVAAARQYLKRALGIDYPW